MSSFSESVTILTLNLANGAGDVYRTPESRQRQAAFIADSGAQLVGMQEVDLSVERSGRADCSREVARMDCAAAAFTPDGVRSCAGAAGTVAFAIGFRGDDPFAPENGLPGGIDDSDGSLNPTGTDRSHDAVYGNALAALGGVSVSDVYAVTLPTSDTQAADDPLFAVLGRTGPSDPARTELAMRNLALRTGPAIEPRVALVARVARDGKPLSVIVTHLESAGGDALRRRQLERVVAVARAERAGPPARNVVVLGDFNQSPVEAGVVLGAADFLRAVGEPAASLENFDQIWIDAGLNVLSAAQVPTRGVSDHPIAGRVTVR